MQITLYALNYKPRSLELCYTLPYTDTLDLNLASGQMYMQLLVWPKVYKLFKSEVPEYSDAGHVIPGVASQLDYHSRDSKPKVMAVTM